MKIAIDISQMVYGTGVSVYTRELVTNLIKLYPDNEYILFGGSLRRRRELVDFADNFHKAKRKIYPIAPTASSFIWNRLHVLPIEYLIGSFNVFHSSDWSEPPSRHNKVTTIHDLSQILFPKETPQKIVITHQRKLSWVLKESRAVIVPSLATKRDAIKFGIEAKRLHVIPEALRGSTKKASVEEIARIRKKYNLENKYALAVGTKPRKNIVRAYEAVKLASKDTGIRQLVVVGENHFEKLSHAICTGRVDDNELNALKTGASVFLYPSLYEGFGLPILEAFKCETPVVTSNISSMPEVAGDAAVLVDPYSVKSIAEGMLKAVVNRSTLVRKGKKRLSHFSWEENAKKTMDLYKSIN